MIVASGWQPVCGPWPAGEASSGRNPEAIWRFDGLSMIVCSCNVISDRALRDAACDLVREPSCGRLTPGAVFRRVGCRPRCGGCFPLVNDIVAAASHAARPPCAVTEASPCTGCAPAEIPFLSERAPHPAAELGRAVA